MSFLRLLVSFLRVFHGLPGQFVPAQVIAFIVMGGGSPVGMRGKLVKFGGSLMGIARHTLILACAFVYRILIFSRAARFRGATGGFARHRRL